MRSLNTTMCGSIEWRLNNTNGFTSGIQGCKRQARGPCSWLTALNEILIKASSNPQEAERREKLKRFVPRLSYLPYPSRSSAGP